MRWILFILLFVFSQAQAQFNPHAQFYLNAIGIAASTQRLNGTRWAKAHTLINALSTNNIQNGVTYVDNWSTYDVVYPMLGDTAHSTALGMDAKRLTVGTWTGTSVFYRDSVKSNGSSGYLATGFTLPVNSIDYQYSYWSTTAVGAPAVNEFFIDMGISTTPTRAVFGIRSYVAGSSGVRAQMYNGANLSVAYPAATTTSMWTLSRNNSTTQVNVYRSGAAITGSPFVSNSANLTPGDLRLFATADAAYRFTNRGCAGATAGTGLTTTQATSQYNAFNNYKAPQQ